MNNFLKYLPPKDSEKLVNKINKEITIAERLNLIAITEDDCKWEDLIWPSIK